MNSDILIEIESAEIIRKVILPVAPRVKCVVIVFFTLFSREYVGARFSLHRHFKSYFTKRRENSIKLFLRSASKNKTQNQVKNKIEKKNKFGRW